MQKNCTDTARSFCFVKKKNYSPCNKYCVHIGRTTCPSFIISLHCWKQSKFWHPTQSGCVALLTLCREQGRQGTVLIGLEYRFSEWCGRDATELYSTYNVYLAYLGSIWTMVVVQQWLLDVHKSTSTITTLENIGSHRRAPNKFSSPQVNPVLGST